MKQKFFFLFMISTPFIVLEVLFRLLPVSSPPYILDVNEKTPVPRFQKNINYLWSNGWDFNIVTRKRTNNFGFVNDYDYFRSNLDPLMVVIGDSYVEANQVANAESVSGMLAKKVQHSGRVYSFGLSGAALSQYLVFAEYAKDEFSPDSMVFIIVGNDYNENLLIHKSAPPFHYFEEKDGKYVLTRIDYKIGILKKILRKSAFVRYLMLNLGTKEFIESNFIYTRDDMTKSFVGNIPRDASDQRLKEYKIGVDEFFHQLPFKSGLDKNKILFVVDGIRPELYSENGLMELKDSSFAQMKTYFIMVAEQLEYEVIDMQPAFIKKNRLDGATFEFPTDGHWNKLGHKLAGSEIEESNVYKRTFLNP